MVQRMFCSTLSVAALTSSRRSRVVTTPNAIARLYLCLRLGLLLMLSRLLAQTCSFSVSDGSCSVSRLMARMALVGLASSLPAAAPR